MVVVNVNTTAPIANAGGNYTTTCAVPSVTIGTASVAGNTYVWTPSTGLSANNIAQPTANPASTTTYTLTVTGANGCTATSTSTVSVDKSSPIADAGVDKNLNCTTSSATIGTASIAGNTYVWTPATGLNASNIAQPIANPSVTTIYTVTVIGPNGCSATDAVIVDVDTVKPQPIITGNIEVCNGSQTQITVSGAQSYLWNTNDTSALITVGVGVYNVTATSSNGCTSTTQVEILNKQGTIGNYVWNDINANGIQDETANEGINGISVQLWSPGIDGVIGGNDDLLLQTTITDNDQNNNPGFYKFIICESGNYYVKFPITLENKVLTHLNNNAGLDMNSDADANGNSPVFVMDINGVGVQKDNNTIDAGYLSLKFIGDYVWMDQDRNGIQDAGELGVAGINVSLLDAATNQILASTTTDAYGYYLFNNIIGGTYRIVFTLPSGFIFTQKNAGNNSNLDSDVDPATGLTDTFTYISGTIDLSRDAGIYMPTPQNSTIGDRVWNDDNQNGIQDPNEVGIANVTVVLLDAADQIVMSTITDANGNYNFMNIMPGQYYIRFTLPIGYQFTDNRHNDSTLNSDANPFNGATPLFTVLAGQNRNDIDAGMFITQSNLPVFGSIGNFVWNDVNNDGLQGIDERGVTNVTVSLYKASNDEFLASTITDPLGNYIFNGILEGEYYVVFSDLPSGFVFSPKNVGNNNNIDSDADQITGRSGIIELLAGQINTSIDAGIHNPSLPIASIGDYVWFDRNNNGLQDLDENGVPGVMVELYNSNDVLISSVMTDVEGKYIFSNLSAGNYYVSFNNLPMGYRLTLQNVGNDNSLDSDPDPNTGKTAILNLAINQIMTNVDAGIIFNNTRNSRASIGNYVWNDLNQNGMQDQNEMGVEGVTVTLYQENGISVISTTTTNALGEYIFNNLLAGNYVVGFTNLPAGYVYSQPLQGIDNELDSDAFPLNGGKSNVIVLEDGEINLSIDAGIYESFGLSTIGDFVWNDLNRNGLQDLNEPGVPGVSVLLISEQGQIVANTTTDGLGRYQFNGVVAGNYRVQFINLPESYFFTNQGDGTQSATDSDADTITGLTPIFNVITGQHYTDIDAGLYTLRSSLGDFVWNDINYNGIQDPGELPLAGVTVTLYNANDEALSMAVTNAAGRYNFVNLTPGSYYVVFGNLPISAIFSPAKQGNDDAFDSDVDPTNGKSQIVTLAEGQYYPHLDAGIHLPSGAGLGDMVWLDLNLNGLQDPNEPGVPGVTITLYNESNEAIKSTVTNQNGMYTFSNLIPGTYSVGFSTLPLYYQANGTPYQTSFTVKNAGDSRFDSDANPITGRTDQYTINVGEYNATVDAGIMFGFVLPALELKAFANANPDNTVDVKWMTLTEVNSDHFEIERSMDASNFEKIAVHEASGNTIGRTEYKIKDKLVGVNHKDVIYYRIKMIDSDGKHSYSNVAMVKLNTNEAEVAVYPSPFTSNLNIQYQSFVSTILSIRITDMNGKIVEDRIVDITEGKNIISIDNLSSLANGNYMVLILDTENGTRNFIKVMKQ